VERRDVDVVMTYNAFTPILFMQLEALGFCGFGKAKDFVTHGHLGLEGALPCNTHGGLIGEGYIHGLNLTTEVIHRLRGGSCNQVPGASTVLVSASRTGVVLRLP
jgi:acetyl-CoA acetyltransferase